MNREIEFRGKWYNGDKFLFGNLHVGNTNTTWFINNIIVDPKTVGQYTGLKDKNGKKIFEGDLIRLLGNKNGALEVIFKNQYIGGWVLKYGDKETSLGARKIIEIEVIGNIHDNPELI